MVFDLSKISSLGDYTEETEKDRILYKKDGKVFLVVNKNTVEVRCDAKLGQVLQQDYESVMKSRYFGNGGVEIVLAGQLDETEIKDLVRLSYNLT